MENFISGFYAFPKIFGSLTDKNITQGYPGCEFQIREALAGVVGKEKSEFFFDKVCPLSDVISMIYPTVYFILRVST